MERSFTKKILWLAVIIIVFLLVDWVCPFQRLTGLPCPGCMMTTALYYLIQLDFQTAFYFNPALYVILIGVLLGLVFHKNKKALKVIFYAVLIIWISIYLYRMSTIFPAYPMHYVEDNILHHFFNLIQQLFLSI